jgi:hypothetical protein
MTGMCKMTDTEGLAGTPWKHLVQLQACRLWKPGLGQVQSAYLFVPPFGQHWASQAASGEPRYQPLQHKSTTAVAVLGGSRISMAPASSEESTVDKGRLVLATHY